MHDGTRARGLVSLALVGLAACGGREAVDTGDPMTTSETAAELTIYRGGGFVLEDADGPARLCGGTLEQSYPPHCTGEELVGWDWSTVAGEETVGASRWGAYEVDVTIDGPRLRLVAARAFPDAPSDGELAGDARPDFSTPCEEPVGGWASTIDQSKVALSNYTAFSDYVNAQPDRSAMWVDNSTDPAFDPDHLDRYQSSATAAVTNIRFTREGARHEAEIRAVWGGPICVVEGGLSQEDMLDLLKTVMHEVGGLSGGLDEVGGRLDVTVLIAPVPVQADLDARYGEGTVVLHPLLVPVASATP